MSEKITLGGKVITYELKVAAPRKSARRTSLQKARTSFARRARVSLVRMVIHPEKGLMITISKRASKADAERFMRSKATWVLKHVERYEKAAKNAPPKLSAKEIEEVKKHAYTLAAARLAHFNTHYHLSFGKITIRNQKTRWGSCSQKRALSFNYKIALLPSPLADYIIVHELCHVAQMNHSPKFWSLVAETIPDYKERRKKLRNHSISMVR